MKEFVKKLIKRLEEKYIDCNKNMNLVKDEDGNEAGHIYDEYLNKSIAYENAIEIVNELATEYKNTNIITNFLQYARNNADNYDTNEGWSLADLIDLSIKYLEEYSADTPQILCRTPQNSADGWIPCSERLPDTEHISGVSETVLVTTDNNSIFTAEYHRDGKWLDDVADWSLEVIAWMPLPAPYKED